MVTPGITVFLREQPDLVAGQRVGLVASAASIDENLTGSADLLHAHPDVQLVALFGPEHGLRGSAQAGDHVSTYTDPRTGLPVYSLYGETQRPTAAMLEGIDTLIYDLQDGGVRFYTYLATLINVMSAAAEYGRRVIVLDRPNPIAGRIIEGPVLDPAYTSFVGPVEIPIRHGLTAGEMARLCNEAFDIGCDLTVVPMRGWRRSMWFDDTGLPFVPPSPNLPTLSALQVYPGTCLIEGSNLSEGRGTTKPFEYIGAPWIDAETLADDLNSLDLPGVRFRPVYFTPTISKYQGELCGGVHMYVRDREVFRPVETTLHLIARVRSLWPAEFSWRGPWSESGQRPIDLLSGGAQVREHLDAGRPVSELVASWQAGLEAFDRLREGYFLYHD